MHKAVILFVSLSVLLLTGCARLGRWADMVIPGKDRFNHEPKVVIACKQDNKDYVGAKEMPPLKAPEGLEAPDTRNALKIPPLNTAERARSSDQPCLDTPPPFSATKSAAPPAPAPASPPAQPREVPTQ